VKKLFFLENKNQVDELGFREGIPLRGQKRHDYLQFTAEAFRCALCLCVQVCSSVYIYMCVCVCVFLKSGHDVHIGIGWA
jgi:hypothetical protein